MRVTKGPTFKALVKKQKQKERMAKQKQEQIAKSARKKHKNPHSCKTPDVKVKDLIDEIKRKRNSIT